MVYFLIVKLNVMPNRVKTTVFVRKISPNRRATVIVNIPVLWANFVWKRRVLISVVVSVLTEFSILCFHNSFNSESALKRKYTLEGKVEKIKLQLAFSSGDLRRASRVMLLLQTENDRSYYLMVAITSDGYLHIEEDREGSAFGAVIERNFLNNIRHSVYYQRTGDDAMLLIDREVVALEPTVVLALTQVADVGSNSVQIGGINTTDPRFAGLKSYSGCLSSSYQHSSRAVSHQTK